MVIIIMVKYKSPLSTGSKLSYTYTYTHLLVLSPATSTAPSHFAQRIYENRIELYEGWITCLLLCLAPCLWGRYCSYHRLYSADSETASWISILITSSKEVMFHPAFVCLSVCLFHCLSNSNFAYKTTERYFTKILPEM